MYVQYKFSILQFMINIIEYKYNIFLFCNLFNTPIMSSYVFFLNNTTKFVNCIQV